MRRTSAHTARDVNIAIPKNWTLVAPRNQTSLRRLLAFRLFPSYRSPCIRNIHDLDFEPFPRIQSPRLRFSLQARMRAPSFVRQFLPRNTVAPSNDPRR